MVKISVYTINPIDHRGSGIRQSFYCKECDRVTMFPPAYTLLFHRSGKCDLVDMDGFSVHACGEFKIWFCDSCMISVDLKEAAVDRSHILNRGMHRPSVTCPGCSGQMTQVKVGAV